MRRCREVRKWEEVKELEMDKEMNKVKFAKVFVKKIKFWSFFELFKRYIFREKRIALK